MSYHDSTPRRATYLVSKIRCVEPPGPIRDPDRAAAILGSVQHKRFVHDCGRFARKRGNIESGSSDRLVEPYWLFVPCYLASMAWFLYRTKPRISFSLSLDRHFRSKVTRVLACSSLEWSDVVCSCACSGSLMSGKLIRTVPCGRSNRRLSHCCGDRKIAHHVPICFWK